MNVPHFQIIIVGSGTAGIIAAAKIKRDIPFISMAVIEPTLFTTISLVGH